MSESAVGGPLVLVACTNVDMREICTLGLRHAGYEVVTVDDPDHVLDVARRVRPDLLISSYPTCTSSGTTVVAAVRADDVCGTTRILNLSAWVRPDDLARAAAAGVSETLALPVSLEGLVGAVQRLVGPASGSRPRGPRR